MAKVILICGTICSGKTTYAKKLMEKSPAALLSMDELMLSLFPPCLGDRHEEISAKCREYLLGRAVDIANAGLDVILDWGFWTRADRMGITEFFRARNVETRWHYVAADEKTLDEHIAKRNALGDAGAYFVDENLKRKCLDRFEEPARGEMDVIV